MSRPSPQRLELLGKMLAKKGIAAPEKGGAIPRRAEAAGDAPTTFGQRRLWFLEQLEPGTGLYNDGVAVRIRGRELDAAALERGLARLAERHGALRTSFHAVDGEPLQRVAERVELPLARAEAAADVDAQLAAEVSAPFDLTRAPLARVLLVRRGERDHELVLTMHHAVSDGVSYGVLWRDLGELYAAETEGREAELGAEPLQLADFAAWERGNADEKELERQLGFWRDELAGAASLALPFDHPRPSSRDTQPRGAFHRFRVPDALWSELQELCRRERATANQALLTVFFALLAEEAGGDDLQVGIGSSMRKRPELESVVGFLVQTLLVRLRIEGAPSFRDLLARTQAKTLEVARHEDVPFDRVARLVERAPGEPTIQVWFGHMRDLLPPLKLEGATSTYRIVDAGSSRFELGLILDETAEGLSGYFEYDRTLFEPQTIERLTERYLALLARAVERPGEPLGEPRASGVSPEMRARLLGELARSPAALPASDAASVLDLFHGTLGTHGDSPAVHAAGATLTYAELASRAARVSAELRARGVGPGDFVGVHAGRSPELVVALVGVLEAGAAYLPLPPDYPAERLAFMLADSGARAVLCRRADAATVPPGAPHTIVVDELTPSQATLEPTSVAPDSPDSPDSPAYTIYTSGSTGKPKGVPISHANLLFSTRARLAFYEEQPTAYLLLSSFAFDSSVAGLFWTLASGGQLVLPPDGFEEDPHGLARLAGARGVTHLLALPSFWAAWLETAAPELATLRTAIVAGEACPPELLPQHRAALPNARLFNEYGPTEATVWTTAFDCARPFESATVPIGRPIPGAEVFLLDPQVPRGQLVPLGQPGEIHIGGPGVAAGYHARPELTAAAFLPHPFAAETAAPTSARLYRTGDLARFLPTGDLEFLGRVDHQVKIRGHRIELGEIESALGEHPSTAEVVVHVPDPAAGRLVAYVRCPEGTPLDAESLRTWLAPRLPAHMLPDAFVALTEFPRLPNGKVDRSALRPPAAERRPHVEPATALERVLAAIWSDVLSTDRVGLDDDFFELGGHSILATKLFARIADTLQVQVPLRTLFEERTLGRLAATMLADPAGRARLERTAELVLLLVAEEEPA